VPETAGDSGRFLHGLLLREFRGSCDCVRSSFQEAGGRLMTRITAVRLVSLACMLLFARPALAQGAYTKAYVADRIRKVEDGVDEFRDWTKKRGKDATSRAQSAQRVLSLCYSCSSLRMCAHRNGYVTKHVTKTCAETGCERILSGPRRHARAWQQTRRRPIAAHLGSTKSSGGNCNGAAWGWIGDGQLQLAAQE
jgi:hypothetical protein